MKKTKGMVNVPTATLNALKNLLFSSQDGVDLTNIINDLTTDKNQRDLVAINVALAYKGITVDLDKNPRYELGYKSVIQHEYLSHSLILNTVTVKSTQYDIDSEGKLGEGFVTYESRTLGMDQWESRTTDIQEVLEQCRNQK